MINVVDIYIQSHEYLTVHSLIHLAHLKTKVQGHEYSRVQGGFLNPIYNTIILFTVTSHSMSYCHMTQPLEAICSVDISQLAQFVWSNNVVHITGWWQLIKCQNL